MFDAVRNNKKIVQIFLALIALPFAFFGVDAYVKNSGAGRDVASVGDSKITFPQFDQALRERGEQIRQSLGKNYRPEFLNSPEIRLQVLNSLIDQRVLQQEIQKRKVSVSNEMLREVIRNVSAFQENGVFSDAQYERVLKAQRMDKVQYETSLRQDLSVQQMLGALIETAVVSNTQTDMIMRLQTEERQYSEAKITAARFADKVTIEPAVVEKYYTDNATRFETPAQVKAEYLMLSVEALMPQINVSEAEIQSAFEAEKAKNDTSERRASHILILTEGSDKTKAKAKAEEVLNEVRKSPAKFAELAKQYSQDPVSAEKGGDLGFFKRAEMVEEFANAAFSLKEGQISDVVQTQYGYHIIKLTAIKPGKQKTLAEMRAELVDRLKRQGAQTKIAELGSQFADAVYEQADSLQGVAEKYKLKIQNTDWISQNPSPQILASLGVMADPKLLAALFSKEAYEKKQNIEALEVAPNTFVAARVKEYAPAVSKPFEQVKADIEKMLRQQEQVRQAKQAGEALLAKLQQGEADKEVWSAPKTSSRLKGRGLPAETLKALFKAPSDKLPSYTGTTLDGDFVLYKVLKVTVADKLDDAQRQALQHELTGILAQEDWSFYIAGLRARYKININQEALLVKERNTD